MSSNNTRDPISAPEKNYFETRAEAERRLAEVASDERVRAVHERLAEEYQLKAENGPANDSE